MKFKTSKRNMKEGYYHIIGAGYCDMQHLLNHEDPIAYSAGVYGWSCDYYEVNGVLISTGYSYIDSKNLSVKNEVLYELITKYDGLARDISYNHKLDYQVKKSQVRQLLNEFLQEVLKQ